MHPAIELIAYDSSWLDELVPMWREGFEFGVGIQDPNPIERQRQYFIDEVLPRNTVRLAVADGRLMGFVAASPESVSQLFVRVGLLRRGLGGRMMDWAKAQSAGSLWLYTFVRNTGARAFYEKQGFVAVAHGFEPTWQLEDVKYQWPAPR
ncbi:GNAT family N-acetyltransferase [Piscinibacter sp.]|uniref:GNAT family N-acetyltransferase n=1 Tax=Piscinibacter sp. TaxID=1903157 RepID=UPI0039E705A4